MKRYTSKKKEAVKVYRLFYPQIAVIVASRTTHRVEAEVLNSVISGSSDPPRVVCAMKREAPVAVMIRKSKSFSVSVLSSKLIGKISPVTDMVS